MEIIIEEDDKELKMYERESMQMKQNLNISEDESNKRESIDNMNNSKEDFRESKTFQEANRFTNINESFLNAIESYENKNKESLSNEDEEKEEENINIEKKDNDENKINNEDNINNENTTPTPTPRPKREKLKEYKIIVLGDLGVGKSSLIYRYLNNTFKNDIPEESIKSENNRKILQIDENIRIRLNIWDTARQEKTGNIFKKYYIDIYGAILVFDLTNKESFQNINKWLKELKDNSPKDIVYCFVGNKSDLIDEKKLKFEEIKELTQDNLYYEVSSKNGNNVSLAFEQLAYCIVEKQIEEENNPDKVLRGTEGRKTTDLKNFKEEDIKPKKSCC